MSACYLAKQSGSTWPTITGCVGKIILKERMSFFPKAVAVSLQSGTAYVTRVKTTGIKIDVQ